VCLLINVIVMYARMADVFAVKKTRSVTTRTASKVLKLRIDKNRNEPN